jgi:hypothetical protein
MASTAGFAASAHGCLTSGSDTVAGHGFLLEALQNAGRMGADVVGGRQVEGGARKRRPGPPIWTEAVFGGSLRYRLNSVVPWNGRLLTGGVTLRRWWRS